MTIVGSVGGIRPESSYRIFWIIPPPALVGLLVWACRAGSLTPQMSHEKPDNVQIRPNSSLKAPKIDKAKP